MPRYTIEFSEEVDKKIENLTKKLDVRTKADVVRKALGLLDYVVREKEAGGRLFVENPDENLRKELVTL